MLIKYSGLNKFIFIANPKCASSSIEASEIGKIADIKLLRSPIGKHISIQEVHDRFDWIFQQQEFSFDRFFKWGIIRDPLNRVISWYNYRSRPTLKNPSKYTGNLSFNEFWEVNKTDKILQPQYNKFFSLRDDSIRVDYLCRQEFLIEDLLPIRNILGINNLDLSQQNTSVKRLKSSDIEETIRNEIKEHYAMDYDLINNIKSFNQQALTLFTVENNIENKVYVDNFKEIIETIALKIKKII
jgi:hypothetical protein